MNICGMFKFGKIKIKVKTLNDRNIFKFVL